MAGILVLLWVFFRLQVGEFYFSGESIAKLSRDMASWSILAAGMTLVIVSGNIDLSVGSLLALVAASCALMMNPEYGPGLDPALAIPIGLVIGTGLGTLQGVLTAYGKIPAFIVTLGGLFVFRGITQKVSEFDPRIPGGSWVVSLGAEYVPPAIGYALAGVSAVGLAAFLIVGRRRRLRLGLPAISPMLLTGVVVGAGAFLFAVTAIMNAYRGIPYQTALMAGIMVAVGIVARWTSLGRHVYAIGGNVEAARLSGVKVERSVVATFALMGFLTAVAGVVWMAQNQGSTKNGGTFYELYAIAGAVIGGTSLMGGRGTILGTVLGCLIMATVVQGMDYTSLENWVQLVVRGSVLVLAVGLDMLTKSPPAWIRRLQLRRWGHTRREQ
jgi:D-xylose transport system permease protein